jgi:N utilization substance protein B
MSPANRRISREIALQVLYQMEFDTTLTPKQGIRLFEDHFSQDTQSMEYSQQLIEGVKEIKTQIDDMIQKFSINWKLNRISHVDRNILRIAIFEMLKLQKEVPPKASINEAIEIAKKFSTIDSGSFINGVLDQISKNI